MNFHLRNQTKTLSVNRDLSDWQGKIYYFSKMHETFPNIKNVCIENSEKNEEKK